LLWCGWAERSDARERRGFLVQCVQYRPQEAVRRVFEAIGKFFTAADFERAIHGFVRSLRSRHQTICDRSRHANTVASKATQDYHHPEKSDLPRRHVAKPITAAGREKRHMRNLLHNHIPAMIIALVSTSCWIDVDVHPTPPDDGGDVSPETGEESTSTGDSATSVLTTTDADSTSAGSPCQGAYPDGDNTISECCPESLGTCADWCEANDYGECLDTIVSVGDSTCESPASHPEWCNIDPFDIIIATEMSVQCLCGEPDESTGTDTGTTTGGCELMDPPVDPPECVSCSDSSQCRSDEDCVCSSDFGSGVCLPAEWNECAWAPCDETCLYVDGAWICSLPGCGG
jgi:hypothetical protein